MGRCRLRKELCRDVVSWEEIRLSYVHYSKKKGKEQNRRGEIAAKSFQMKRLRGR